MGAVWGGIFCPAALTLAFVLKVKRGVSQKKGPRGWGPLDMSTVGIWFLI